MALNMAAVVDPTHVRMVFSEGAPSAAIGMPDQIWVPLKMVFGRIDNYVGRTADDWMHLRTDPCVVNQPAEGAALGTAQRCSLQVNPTVQGLSPFSGESSSRPRDSRWNFGSTTKQPMDCWRVPSIGGCALTVLAPRLHNALAGLAPAPAEPAVLSLI